MAMELPGSHRATGLVDVLDRVLDKGLVIAGDIKVSLAEVELLTIRIRLIVCSLDKAREIGLDWWMYDRHLAPGSAGTADRERLEQRLAALEQRLGVTTNTSTAPTAKIPKGAPRARRREPR